MRTAKNGKPSLLLAPKDIKPSNENMRVRGVFNPGAIRLENGKIMLMARVAETPIHGKRYFLAPKMTGLASEPKMKIEEIPRSQGEIGAEGFVNRFGMWRLPTISHFRKVLLDESGTRIESISQQPDFSGCGDEGQYGIEDPRIVHFKKDKKYAMTYVTVSHGSGVSTSLAVSKNLSNWQRKGIIFRQQNKDVVLFPEKINGYYVALHRPEGVMIFDKPSIWISYSKDLIFWGKDKPLLAPRRTGWDSLRIGAGTSPIKTKEGYLEIYHGVALRNKNDPDSQKIYRAGALLFDLKNPEKILAQTPRHKPLFKPEGRYEKKGFLNDIVFPNSNVLSENGKKLIVYSGGADSHLTVRELSLKKILNSMQRLKA